MRDIIQTVKKHTNSIVSFFILINLMALSSFFVVFTNHIKYIDNQIDKNIIEYKEINNNRLCSIANCIRVADLNENKCYTPINGHLKIENFRNNEYSRITGALYITDTWHLTIYNKKANAHFAINVNSIMSDFIHMMFYFLPLSLLIYIYPLTKAIRVEKEENILKTAGSEALLANKSMINITENIHHELNTPLEVIDNKIEKIHRELGLFLEEEYSVTQNLKNIPLDRVQRNNRLEDLNQDFYFIKTSSEQIYAVLEKMKGFKHLRYSNGNKNLEDIIDGGFKIINISNTNFDYQIDERLKEYRIGTDKLKNADFLSIILNHIKNSLEANASKILILFNKESKGKLYIRFIDNGSGIPEKVQSKIFIPNFSTKSTDSGIRGNGMYLNKQILKNAGGNIHLISSSNRGTTLELEIPVKR